MVVGRSLTGHLRCGTPGVIRQLFTRTSQSQSVSEADRGGQRQTHYFSLVVYSARSVYRVSSMTNETSFDNARYEVRANSVSS